MTDPTSDWDPAVYEHYKAQRDRPALDLLLQVPGDLDPRRTRAQGTAHRTGRRADLHPTRIARLPVGRDEYQHPSGPVPRPQPQIVQRGQAGQQRAASGEDDRRVQPIVLGQGVAGEQRVR